jgi:hypothetical protein
MTIVYKNFENGKYFQNKGLEKNLAKFVSLVAAKKNFPKLM